MEESQWRLGDPCFIAIITALEHYASMKIMPAAVTKISGGGVWATAYSTEKYGPFFYEGAPFRTEEAAREHLADYAHRVATAVQAAEKTGERPILHLPAVAPKCGEIVYLIEKELGEVIEAQIGIVEVVHGCLMIGYDQSPGNPEASNIQAREWWSSKDEALHIAQERHGRPFAFVSKEELAARTNAAIEKHWDDALERAKSPEFAAMFNNLEKSLLS